MKRLERLLAVIGAAALLVASSAVATEASNGSTIKFGKSNKGTKTTTLQVTSGTASPLKLTGKTTSAPLVTNMTGQVANLNASMVGGASLSSLIFRDSTSPHVGAGAYTFTVPAGTYMVSLYANVAASGGASTATPKQFTCWVEANTGDAYEVVIEAMTIDLGTGRWPTLSSSRVYNVVYESMSLYCDFNGAGWTVPQGGSGPSVTFTRVPASTVTELPILGGMPRSATQ